MFFLARPHEINWLFQAGASYMQPKAWQEFIKPLTANERSNILASYYSYLLDPDINNQKLWAKRFTTWELSISYLQPKKISIDNFYLSLARLECHYLFNQCFLTNNYILNNINSIKNITMFIVQGKYDLVCPPSSAYELQQAHSNSKLFLEDFDANC